MLTPGGAGDTSKVKLGLNIWGSQEEAEGREEQVVENGGETVSVGASERGLGDSGMETIDAQVGGGSCEEAGYDETNTGDYQVGGRPRTGEGVDNGAIPGLCLGVAGWHYGNGSGDYGQGRG